MLNYLDYSYSKPKGQTKAGTVFASSINMGKSDPNYTSDYVDGEFTLADGNGRLAWTPVNIATLFEIVEGDNEATVAFGAPNASGVCTGTITSTKGTVGVSQFDLNPITGDYTIAGGTSNTTVVKYYFNNENVRSDGTYFDNDGNAIGAEAGWTNVPEIELRINSVPIEAKARTLRSFWSFDASYELQKELTKVA